MYKIVVKCDDPYVNETTRVNSKEEAEAEIAYILNYAVPRLFYISSDGAETEIDYTHRREVTVNIPKDI